MFSGELGEDIGVDGGEKSGRFVVGLVGTFAGSSSSLGGYGERRIAGF